jgi:hypothetical protein
VTSAIPGLGFKPRVLTIGAARLGHIANPIGISPPAKDEFGWRWSTPIGIAVGCS